MDKENTYDPNTDAVLLDLTHNTIVDVNVDLARELGFTLKNGEIHATDLDLFTTESIESACNTILVSK